MTQDILFATVKIHEQHQNKTRGLLKDSTPYRP